MREVLHLITEDITVDGLRDDQVHTDAIGLVHLHPVVTVVTMRAAVVEEDQERLREHVIQIDLLYDKNLVLQGVASW